MRRKIWSDREFQSPPSTDATPGAPSPSTDRVEELLAMIEGGEGSGGGTPCAVGVPPWFLGAMPERVG